MAISPQALVTGAALSKLSSKLSSLASTDVLGVAFFENSSDIVCSLNIARDTSSAKPLTVIINSVTSVARSPTPCTEWASNACSCCCSRADGRTRARGRRGLNVRGVSRIWRYSESSTTRTPLPAVVLNGTSNLALWAEHRVGWVIAWVIAWVCVHWSPSPARAYHTPNDCLQLRRPINIQAAEHELFEKNAI
jgi:hypothetical protein